MTIFRTPNYEEIRFDLYIEKIFPNINAFISSECIGDIRNILKNKYGNDSICFEEATSAAVICFRSFLRKGFISGKLFMCESIIYILNPSYASWRIAPFNKGDSREVREYLHLIKLGAKF
jgi:hypothetical protein